ncbi:MAG: hypothetical protein OXU71_00225 [Gammaproteobacteria bacterium]|nr:hypothetical protein [Gammaproteobacteria bacterium]
MKFEICGPFEIPRGNKGVITDVKQFWKELAEEWGEGLVKAHGAYVFAIKSARGTKPWYVGKAGKTFKQEALNAENIKKYNGKLDTVTRGKPWLFLLPELNDGGGFSRKTESAHTKALELMLIERALAANPNLLNSSNTKLLREIEVFGFINSRKPGKPSEAVQEFKKCFS